MITVPLAMFGWPVLALLFFALLSPRRAIMASFLFAWLFLPIAEYKLLPGLPVYNRMTATNGIILFCLVVFDARRLLSFRPRLVDLPVAIWCASPFVSSLLNGLGPLDGLSSVFYQAVTWGIPHVIGRLYFTRMDELRDLAVAIVLGGLIYVPLCLLEMRMSPMLHSAVYGYHQHSFAQSLRFGGWRPTVFMEHGLMVGMWMCMSALTAVWLWKCGTLARLGRFQSFGVIVLLGGTAVGCKSTGALVLLLGGLLCLWLSRSVPKPVWLLALAAVAPLYCATRAPRLWSAREIAVVADNLSEERANSLRFRLENEDMLTAKASTRPLFGWAGWGRSRVYDEFGNDLSVTDGLWVIQFGQYGVVGLVSMLAAFLMPVVTLVRRIPVRYWTGPAGPAAALAVMVSLYALDCIANAMINPIYMLAAAGVAGMTLRVREAAPAPLSPARAGGAA